MRELNLRVEQGQVLGLVGESGSGKSVTALAVLRLLDPMAHVEGAIRFGGVDLLALAPEAMRKLRGREIAMVFQEPMTALNPVMCVGEQIAEAIRVLAITHGQPALQHCLDMVEHLRTLLDHATGMER